MGRPSESQLNFVSDIEKGCSALLSQGIEVKKIAQVTEAAGREMPEVSQFVARFVDQGHWQLIDRLSAAFSQVGRAPLCIERARTYYGKGPMSQTESEPSNFEPEPLQLVRELPIAQPVTYQPDAYSGRIVGEAETCAVEIVPPKAELLLAEVIQLINRLPQPIERKKVAGMAANWFGVGG